MTTRTITEVLTAAYGVGFTTEDQLLAVVGIGIAESSLNDSARNWHPEFGYRPATDVIDVDGGDSHWNMPARTQQEHSDRGIFQISSHFHHEYDDPTCDDLNLATVAMWGLSSHGTDFTPWDTYVSGDAQAHYDVAFDGWPAIRPLVEAFLVTSTTTPPTLGGSGITRTFDQAFYRGNTPSSSGASSQHRYDIVLGGRGYMIDWDPPSADMAFGFHTLPLLQRYYLTQEQGNIGEQSLNPEDYWRRSPDDWHFGAGQKYNDRSNSERGQYRDSRGIDPWTIGEMKLLPATVLVAAASQPEIVNLDSNYLYMLDATLSYATDLTGTFTDVAGGGGDGVGVSPRSLTTDGYTIYFADDTRVHYTVKGDATYLPYHTSDEVVDLVRVVKGRVLTAAGNVLYVNTGAAGSAVQSPLLAQPNPDFTWVDIAGGPAAIYFAGYSGDKSVIYSTQVVNDGTNLAVPAVAAELPDGELVRSLGSYLGVLLIGTTKGVRIAPMDASGNLNVQGLIETPEEVLAFEPQDRFVWFGGGDAETSDLYRMDLSVFNGTTPAYAGDLLGDDGTNNRVRSIVTWDGLRVYAKANVGIIAEDPDGNLMEEGTLWQGWWNYNLPDSKQAIKLSTQFVGNGGTIIFSTAADFSTSYEQAGAVISSSENAESRVLPVGNTEGVVHEVKVTLSRSPLDPTSGPSVTRYTLMSNPQPQRRVTITVPLMLHTEVQAVGGDTITVDPAVERAAIDTFCQSGQIISYQDPAGTYSVTVDDYDWIGYQPVGSGRSLDGTLGVKLKIVG